MITRVRPDPAVRAFGASASAWAQRLAPDLPLVATDLEPIAAAFAETARRRKRGDRFAAAVFIDDPRARFALYHAAPPVLAQVTERDARAELLDAVAVGGLVLNGKNQREMERYDGRYLRTAQELLTTADVVVTRSSVERERLSAFVNRRFVHSVTLAPVDPGVPAPGTRRGTARAIVVWAPEHPAEACGLYAFAFEEFRRPVIVVSGAGQPPPMRAGTRFVRASDGAAALAEAAVIVDGSVGDPGTARALARWNVPLAVASSTGAGDWLDGVTTFDPWNYRTLAAAVANALGGRGPRERAMPDEAAEFARSLAHAEPPMLPDPPLVSVIVPTMNRRESMFAALASVDAQTYGYFEIVLVNDGGPPLDRQRLSAVHPLRIVEYAGNRGVSAAVNRGIDASTGTYIAVLADDDLFCPDHLAQLAGALERAGADVAHAVELGEHAERNAAGIFAVTGHSIIAGEPAMPTLLQACNVIGGPSIMFTRAAFEQAGPFDERAGHLMDLEMWMRMSERFDFIHVDRVTAVMTMRDDTSQASAVSGPQTAALYRTIYELHPTTRRIVADARDRQLREVEAISIVRTLPQLRL